MSSVVFDMSMSLDGYVRAANPLSAPSTMRYRIKRAS